MQYFDVSKLSSVKIMKFVQFPFKLRENSRFCKILKIREMRILEL